MKKITISFRDQTFGKINDVCSDEGLQCAHTTALLSYLAGALVSYREEGVELSPSVVVCANIRDVLKAIPGCVNYEIGACDLDADDVGTKILKQCGVLAAGTWAIYVERANGRFAFGIVGYPATPLTLGLAETIPLISESFAILMRKSAQNTIEVVGRKGKHLYLVFSTMRDDATPNSTELIQNFSQSAASQLAGEKFCDEFINYLSILFGRVLDKSHGAILAVVSGGDLASVSQVRDYVRLIPEVSLSGAYSRFREEQTADALVSLQSLEGLLQGFVLSDGVLMFDQKGAVIAYRGFHRPEGESRSPAPVGGARRRAFDGICAGLSGGIASLLFRSQDGLTIFNGGNHV